MEIEDSLTTLRIILAPVVMALIFSNEIIAAFYLYLVAVITDIFDGYFARKYKRKSEGGDLFDALADLTLIYFAVFAIGVARESTAMIAVIVITLALVIYPLGIISMKKKTFAIPHLTSSKVLAWFVHPTVMAYIINWQYAQTLFIIGLAVGVYTAVDYIVYGIKQKSL